MNKDHTTFREGLVEFPAHRREMEPFGQTTDDRKTVARVGNEVLDALEEHQRARAPRG